MLERGREPGVSTFMTSQILSYIIILSVICIPHLAIFGSSRRFSIRFSSFLILNLHFLAHSIQMFSTLIRAGFLSSSLLILSIDSFMTSRDTARDSREPREPLSESLIILRFEHSADCINLTDDDALQIREFPILLLVCSEKKVRNCFKMFRLS